MPQLAANWPDKLDQNVRLKSSLIGLETLDFGRQGGSLYEGHRERLSEKTLSISRVAKRCDSPNPERLLLAFKLWMEDLTWKEISVKTGLAERTMRRYFAKQGFKRDYSFISQKLTGIKRSDSTKKKISIYRVNKRKKDRIKNPNWLLKIKTVWTTPEFREWRTAVFIRDNYICKGCGVKNGQGKTIELNAHHILPRRDFPHLTFDISNGVTLCVPCHNKTKKKEYLSVNIWKQRVQQESV